MRGARQEEIVLSGAVTVAEAAAELGVSFKWIFRRIKAGRLHVVGRDGRCILVASSPTAYLPPAASSPPSSSYATTMPGELCKIAHSGQDSAFVTVLGARAKRVLATVIPPDRQVPDGDGWRVPVAVLPLLQASMRLRGVRVEMTA